MVSRWYPTGTAAPITPTGDAVWDADAATFISALCSQAVNDYAQFGSSGQSTGVANGDVRHGRLVIGPLAAQTILGGAGNTVKGQLFPREASGTVDARAQVVIRVIASDGSTVRGTLLAGDTAALSSEFLISGVNTSLDNRKFPRGGAIALTQVIAQEGDYIVIEFGERNHGTTADTVRIWSGVTEPGTTDAPEDETTNISSSGSVYRGWIEFSQNIQLFKTASDTGSGTESRSLSASETASDTGSGADASSMTATNARSDTGAGVDATASLSVALLRVDTGSGADALGNRTLAAFDSGVSVDLSALTIITLAVSPFPILPLTLAVALRRHHIPISRITFIEADLETIIHEVDGRFMDGSVDMERSRQTHRSGSVRLVDELGLYAPAATGLVWPNRLVRLERGVMIAGTPQYVELLTGVLDEWSISSRSGLVAFSVWSRLHLADTQFSEPVTFQPGAAGPILRAIAELGGLGVDDELYSIVDGGALLAEARTYDTSDNILQSMLKLAFDLGLDLYDDGHGRTIIEPFSDPATAETAWEFVPGVSATMTDASRSGRAVRVYNRATVVGTGPDRYPIRAEWRVTNPDDPLYNPVDGSGPVGDRPRPTYTSSDISTQAAANAVAARLGIEGALYEESIAISSVPIPLLVDRDVVRFSELGVDDRYLLDKVSIPLRRGAMQLSTRRVRSLLNDE